MKPLKIEISGLNSYIDPQTIDFEVLSKENLFCIVGETGSGKTTIFDGIVLGLYGSKALNNRGSAIEDFINTNCTKAKIIFKFEYQNKVYIIERIFYKNNKPTLAKLYCEEKLIADSVDEVNKIILDILGLDYKEFTKCVLIRQGEFDKLIKDKHSDRNVTLSKLFDLEKYNKKLIEKINNKLNEKNLIFKQLEEESKKYQDITLQVLNKNKQLEKILKKDIISFEEIILSKQKNLDIIKEKLKRYNDYQNLLKEKQKKLKELNEINIQKKEIQLLSKGEELDAFLQKLKDEKNNLEFISNNLKKINENNTLIIENKSNNENKKSNINCISKEIVELEKKGNNLDLLISEDTRLIKENIKIFFGSIDLFCEKLKEKIKIYESNIENEIIYQISSKLKTGDICPVCGNKYIKKNKNNLNKFEREEIDNYKEQLDLCDKIKNYFVTKFLGEFDYEITLDNNENYKIYNNIDEIKEYTKDFKKQMNLIKENKNLKTQNEKKYNEKLDDKKKKIQEIELIDKDINNFEKINKILKEQIKDQTKNHVQIIDLEKINDKLNKLNVDIENLETYIPKINEINKQIILINNWLKENKIIEVEKVEEQTKVNLEEELKKDREQLNKKNVEIGQNQERIKNIEQLLLEKKELNKKINIEKKDKEIIEELKSLISNGKFFDWIIAEYIQELTIEANKLLELLCEGKYTLSFENKDFIINDFLNGNEKRKISTLSGGESFLISLALALALASLIGQGKFGKFGFFFIDEGFGTLSDNVLDLIEKCLKKISQELIVGVITHRKELTERIYYRILVEHATSKSGSKIIIDY